MKKLILFIAFGCLAGEMPAQEISRQSIEDSVIGWMTVYHFKGVKTGMKVDSKVYSANQLSVCDSFANWIQASYMPKGGLGDVKKFVSEKLGLYNQYKAGMPQSYGAYAKTYTELKYNSSRKLVPFTNSHVWMAVAANGIPNGWPVMDICTPAQYYFTLPMAATEVSETNMLPLLDISGNASIKPFTSFWVKNLGYGRGKEQVLLCKDNKSPFIILTKGEFLQALEKAIPVFYEKEKKRIYEAEQGNQQRLVFPMKQLDEKIIRYKTGLEKTREKYRNRLNEPATTSYQPNLVDLDFGRDIFTSQYLTDPETTQTRYPVYTVDPALTALCKTDKPQWILISWDYWPGDATEQQQHDAIISNLNLEYIYNFFFAPEKIKGQLYKPLHNPR